MTRALIALTFLLAVPLPSAAQVVRGRVLDEATRTPLANVVVSATGPSSARALSDSLGWFRLDLPTGGTYAITAERIGYPRIAQQLTTSLREDLVVEIKLAPAAIALQPLTIIGRTAANRSGLEGYYQRAEWADKIGIGTILRRSDIERRAAGRTIHLLGASTGAVVRGDTIRLRRGGTPCRPEVFLDGVRGVPGVVDVEIQSIEGIEIYRGPAQMPAEFLDRTGCGSVLIWTRRAESGSRPMKWRHIVVGLGIVAAIIAVAR